MSKVVADRNDLLTRLTLPECVDSTPIIIVTSIPTPGIGDSEMAYTLKNRNVIWGQ